MIKSIRERAVGLLRTIHRFWNWRKKTTFSGFGVSEELVLSYPINNIYKNDVITSAIIHFPSIEYSAAQRRKEKITFVNCVFALEKIKGFTFSSCSFEGCSFNGAFFSDVEFHKSVFSECYFYKTRFSETYLDPRTIKFSDDWHWDRSNVNTWLFQALYKNFKSMHQEKFAMYADKKFQFYLRYQYLRGKKPNLIRFFWNLLYDYFMGYGYGIVNTLLVTIIIVFVFAFLMCGNMLKEDASFWEVLYFSVVSFTTVGYGELTPSHDLLPLFITGVFLLISVGWCAVVTAIIVKRIVK
ncbi:potassium ABC transporter [Pseudomonas marginalis ICMP 9505]|nr:potassium ABC transporter [Pseudomonas marginalis ICMP 9505]